MSLVNQVMQKSESNAMPVNLKSTDKSFIKRVPSTSRSMPKDETVKYTKYEKARLIGARALQISMGAPFTVQLSEKDLEAISYNPVEIAKKEFEAGVLPIDIRRTK